MDGFPTLSQLSANFLRFAHVADNYQSGTRPTLSFAPGRDTATPPPVTLLCYSMVLCVSASADARHFHPTLRLTEETSRDGVPHETKAYAIAKPAKTTQMLVGLFKVGQHNVKCVEAVSTHLRHGKHSTSSVPLALAAAGTF